MSVEKAKRASAQLMHFSCSLAPDATDSSVELPQDKLTKTDQNYSDTD